MRAYGARETRGGVRADELSGLDVEAPELVDDHGQLVAACTDTWTGETYGTVWDTEQIRVRKGKGWGRSVVGGTGGRGGVAKRGRGRAPHSCRETHSASFCSSVSSPGTSPIFSCCHWYARTTGPMTLQKRAERAMRSWGVSGAGQSPRGAPLAAVFLRRRALSGEDFRCVGALRGVRGQAGARRRRKLEKSYVACEVGWVSRRPMWAGVFPRPGCPNNSEQYWHRQQLHK